jgi:hypothetical protein
MVTARGKIEMVVCRFVPFGSGFGYYRMSVEILIDVQRMMGSTVRVKMSRTIVVLFLAK